MCLIGVEALNIFSQFVCLAFLVQQSDGSFLGRYCISESACLGIGRSQSIQEISFRAELYCLLRQGHGFGSVPISFFRTSGQDQSQLVVGIGVAWI